MEVEKIKSINCMRVSRESTRRFEKTGLVPLHINDMQVLSD